MTREEATAIVNGMTDQEVLTLLDLLDTTFADKIDAKDTTDTENA